MGQVVRRAGRWCAAVALVAASATAGVVPAQAQQRLTSSSPASGETVASLPSAVTLTFDGPVAPHPLTVAVRGPDRIRVDVEDATVRGATVTQPTAGAGVPGRYLLAYRVAVADGHAVIGELTFTIDPATASDPAQGPGASLWARTAGPAAVVGVLGTGVVVAARRRTRTVRVAASGARTTIQP